MRNVFVAHNFELFFIFPQEIYEVKRIESVASFDAINSVAFSKDFLSRGECEIEEKNYTTALNWFMEMLFIILEFSRERNIQSLLSSRLPLPFANNIKGFSLIVRQERGRTAFHAGW